MGSDSTDRTRPEKKKEVVFVGEYQEFTDPPGGADLNDPEVQNRPRLGRPSEKQPQSDENETQSSQT
jgi:hypothetical protein